MSDDREGYLEQQDRSPVGSKTGSSRQAALFRLSAELAAAQDETEVCQRVVNGLHDTLGYDFVAFFLVDESTGDRVMGASVGFEKPPERLKPGRGLSEGPVLSGKLQYTPNVHQDPRYFYGMGGSEVDVPVWISDKVHGVLVAESKTRDDFNSEDIEVLIAASQQAGIAIEKARLLAEERQRGDELDALRATLTELTAELELPVLLRAIVERAAGLLNAAGGELALYDHTNQELEIFVSFGLGKDYTGTRHKLGEGAMGLVAQTGEPLILEDYNSWESQANQYKDAEIHAIMAVPLKLGKRLIGVITVVAADVEQKFSSPDVHLLNLFAQQAAIAIENARLFDEAQREIKERIQFEGEIQRQKEYFEALFVNNPVAVVTADLEGVVVSWNPMAESLFGYSPEEAVGTPLDDLVAKDESIQAEALGYTKQALELSRVQVTTKRTRKDGSMVDVELLALPIIVEGKSLGFIAIYYDLTELEKARREAEAANQAKSLFLANMSHELRTPLNAILGFSQLMDRDQTLTSEQQENLGVITRSGEHLLGLINDVLEMSKIEAGQVELQERIFDLYDMLNGLEEMFSLRAAEKSLGLNFEWSQEVPRHVLADEGKLRQVLSNLLGNAVKFTREGEVTLRVKCATHSKEMARLQFEVEDTGPGIAAQDLAVVFDPFVQSSLDQRFQEGTGLGLSISRQYVTLMGGDLSVDSEIGMGSLFKFDLLVEIADGHELQQEDQYKRVIALVPGQREYRLLIAEDNESNRQLLVKLLEPLGFNIKEAVNGQEVLQIWEQWRPDLIWMDMRMPILDGHQATTHIKAAPQGKDTVIIALTATAFEEERERVLFEGSDDFIRKPFQEWEIFDMLAKHLGVRFIYDEPPQPDVPAAVSEREKAAADINAAPLDLIHDLQDATITADMSRIINLIEQISTYSPIAAETLADHALNFEYKSILELIDNSGDER